ncbi:hypothetical protein [Shewanella algae]|uniref:hypothetical protein n=1 Tax=Shewanella algae TaxID=38313 RepID=UPI0031F4CC1F
MKNARKRKKVKKAHEIISSIVNPKVYLGDKNKAKFQLFCNFVIESDEQEFESAINVILKDEYIFSRLNQSKVQIDEMFKKSIINPSSLSRKRAIKLYKAILLNKIDCVSEFFRIQNDVEDCLLKGQYEKVYDLMERLNETCGQSLWGINVLFAAFTASKEYSKIDEYLESIKKQSESPFLLDVVRVTAWKSQAVDAEIIIESMVRRVNKEFIDGGADVIAALYSITCLNYSYFDDVNICDAIKSLQQFSIVDLADSLIKIAQYYVANELNDVELRDELVLLFEKLNETIASRRISKIILALTNEKLGDSDLFVDDQVRDYNEGRYLDVIDSLESDFSSVENLISKVNIYAKSYIYLNREPAGLSGVINDVIRSLISIYSLRDSNQALGKLINIAIKFSSLELSDHILVSIVKSAPYYFLNESKERILNKSKLLSSPLTPLAYNLSIAPSLYLDSRFSSKPQHSLVKKLAISAIFSESGDADSLVDDYYNASVILKDAIELKIELYLSKNDYIGLIKFSSDELIGNPNANVCLPLSDVIEYIDNNHLYTLDSVICSYFHNLYSKSDNSSVLNEVFEEYVISLGVSRPSELISFGLSDKELFILKDVAKIEVMDYLGSFEDESDLKIERINILNRLVEFGYLEQNDVDRECKYIVDDILIESEAAKFNDSKIFVDTKHIYNKRKNDIDSLLIQYQSSYGFEEGDTSGSYAIESMTVLKGGKNEIITRLINILLIEFMNNQEVGLDANLSSEIRHGFFSNLMCSNLQKRNLLAELDDADSKQTNKYWMSYYRVVNIEIMNDINNVLVQFSNQFNKLVEEAEQWMKTTINVEDDSDRVFYFEFTVDDFELIRKFIDSTYEHIDSEKISNYIFSIFNSKLIHCLDMIKERLNTILAVKIDELFSLLIEEINENKCGASLSDLLEQIKLANTEVKEEIKTVCGWFSLRKSTEFKSFDIMKTIKLAEKCFKQINNCKIEMSISSSSKGLVEGNHLYALVFTLINCFDNCYKYSSGESKIRISVSDLNTNGFKIIISNDVDESTRISLESGCLRTLVDKLETMNDDVLLTNEGGSGLYKSLHGLRKVSSKFNIIPRTSEREFNVEVVYAG